MLFLFKKVGVSSEACGQIISGTALDCLKELL